MPSGGGPGIPAAPGGLPPFRPGFCFPRRRPPMSSPPCWAGSDSRQPPGSALMPFDELHRCVASIALRAAGQKYEVALAGGNALMVHQVVSRHTEDVDLFVRRLRNVAPAAAEIQAALLAAGYATERLDVAGAGGLGDLWPEAGEELAEWEVTAPDGEHTVQVQVAYFETLADPVTVPDLGPVDFVLTVRRYERLLRAKSSFYSGGPYLLPESLRRKCQIALDSVLSHVRSPSLLLVAHFWRNYRKSAT